MVDMYDTMVSEYAEEIFEYMGELEVRPFPITSNNFLCQTRLIRRGDA